MGIVAFIAGLITVMGTLGFIETESTITNLNAISIAIQLAGGLLLTWLGTEFMLLENNN